jgi:pimeloyl-ACP methyl ester carboxylesterase
MRTIALIVAAATIATSGALAQVPQIVTEEMMVPSDVGTEIFVRNKRPSGMISFRPERTVLIVHGATYPASTSYDMPFDGVSWVDYIAVRGYDVYLLDVRGYGRSTRPKEMDQKPDANPPVARGVDAVKDIGAAVDFILKRRNIPRLNLIGHSWGTVLMAAYSTQQPAKVERLVLYAPVWLRNTPSLIQTGPGPLGAYRMVTAEQARARRLVGVPENKKANLFSQAWFDAWEKATWASDPIGAKMNPPVIRAPNGSQQDSRDYWLAGKPYYDPAKITAPTLLVHGEWDQDTPRYMAQTLFPLLVNSPEKRYVELAEGTHSMYMQRNRVKLFEAVQSFLDEAGRS